MQLFIAWTFHAKISKTHKLHDYMSLCLSLKFVFNFYVYTVRQNIGWLLLNKSIV